MRYRLPFAIAPVNWSQLPATRQITLVPKSQHLARFKDAWASTPRPGSLTICSVRLGAPPIVELRVSLPLRSAHQIPPKKRAPSAALGSQGRSFCPLPYRSFVFQLGARKVKKPAIYEGLIGAVGIELKAGLNPRKLLILRMRKSC